MSFQLLAWLQWYLSITPCPHFLEEYNCVVSNPSHIVTLVSTALPTSTSKYDKPFASQILHTSVGDKMPHYDSSSHALENCKAFNAMSLEDKKKGINENRICVDSRVTSKKCKECGSKCHYTLFQSDLPKKSDWNSKTRKTSDSAASDNSQKNKPQWITTATKKGCLLLSAPSSVEMPSMEESVGRLFFPRSWIPSTLTWTPMSYWTISQTLSSVIQLPWLLQCRTWVLGIISLHFLQKTSKSGRKITCLKIQGGFGKENSWLSKYFQNLEMPEMKWLL